MSIKGTVILILSVAMLALVVGCGKTDDSAADQGVDDTEMEATKTAATGFEQLKTNYVAKAEQVLSDWDAKVTDIVAKKGQLPEVARKPLEEPIKLLVEQKGALSEQFDKLKAAGEETFDAEKAAFEQVSTSISEAYAKAAGLF